MNTFSNRGEFPLVLKVVIAALLGVVVAFLFRFMSSDKTRIDPVLLSQIVSRYSNEFSVDEDLVHSVIMAESSQIPNVVSRAGAIGLMQIMPDTAEYLSNILRISAPSDSELKDPETNVKLGCFYLSLLKKQFGNSPEVVLAAYNAGPTRVKRWLTANQDKNAVQIVLNCPISETRMYIRKVMGFLKDRREQSM